MIKPDFEKMNGLVPAIAQDAETGEILMMAYMNEEAWNKTLETGDAHYWSRSRNTLWHKGGTSGMCRKSNPLRLIVMRIHSSCSWTRSAAQPVIKDTEAAFIVKLRMAK